MPPHLGMLQVRGDTIVSMLCEAISPLLPVVASASIEPLPPAAATDVGSLADLLSAVLPCVAAGSIAPLAALTAALLDALRRTPAARAAAASSSKSRADLAADRAEIALLRLLLGLCHWMAALLEGGGLATLVPTPTNCIESSP